MSQNQLSLKEYLEEVIPRNLLVPELFYENLFRALVLFGDCRGIAHVCRDGGGTILCRWLRSELAISFDTRQQNSPIRKQLLILADQIDFNLVALRENRHWQFLFEDPHPSSNRLIQFQLAISGSPAYHLVAAKLHRGICAKTIQLRHLDRATFNDRLGNYVQPLPRIVRSIPVAKVKKTIFNYKEGQLDKIVWEVVNSLPRLSIGLAGRTSYSTNTLMKFYSTWIASYR